MLIEVKTPELSESVQSGTLLNWRVQPGEAVQRDQTLADLETDKVILEVAAPASGVLREQRAAAGTEVRAGDVLAVIDDAATAAAAPSAPAAPGGQISPASTPIAPPAAVQPAPAAEFLPPRLRGKGAEGGQREPSAPAASVPTPKAAPLAPMPADPRGERREPMSRLRSRIAERLKQAQETAAILTTFNEINMQAVMDLRRRHQEAFLKRHGVKLGFMSFFTQATCHALRAYPVVNARIEGNEVVHPNYIDIGVAVSSERGLVVPVLRDAEGLGLAEIERRIADFGQRANALTLGVEDLMGGTFTISNGGVFGSLLSTPILNPPQSGVLGLHKIQERPIAENGQVVIRPMMYVALSYDHRLIDGREAVSFLREIKEVMEDPARLVLAV